jgi:hypothetical protein
MDTGQVEELQQANKLTREEIRNKLRAKIGQKRSVRKGGVTRKDAQTLSDKIEKLVQFLKDKNITVNTPLTEEIMEKVTDILSINEMKKIMSQIESNPEVSDNFKHFMNNALKFKPP